MGIQTENLGLYEKESSDYATDNFNIQSMLNDNWDKIDDAIGDLPNALTDMGLDEHGSVADAVRKLADFGNWYVWKQWTKQPATTENERSAVNVLYASSGASSSTGSSYYMDFDVADNVSVTDDGTVSLDNPTTVRVYRTSSDVSSVDALHNGSLLLGKYIKFKASWSTKSDQEFDIKYIPEDASITNRSSISASTTAYSIYCRPAYYVRGLSIENASKKNGTVSYATHPDATKYPENGSSGNYWYELQGKSGKTVDFELLEYRGTGTYGESNPTTWTFSFAPKAIIISVLSSSTYNLFASELTESYVATTGKYWSGYVWNGKKSADGKTIYCYAAGDSYQFNQSGKTYRVIAFG